MSSSTACHFDFFGALGVSIHAPTDHPYLLGYRKKFEHYRVDRPLPEPGLTFCIEPFTLDEQEARVFNRYRIKPDQLARTHSYKIARWQSQARGVEGLSWEVMLWGNRASSIMVPHLTMTALTQLALACRGWVPIHAAALYHPERQSGLVLAGRRGVGKTTLSGRLLRDGWRLVSEDRVYLHGGVVYGLRTPVNMKYDRHDPRIVSLPPSTRWRLKRNHLIAMASGGYVRLHEPVSLTELIPDQLEDQCPLSRLVYLQSGGDEVVCEDDAAIKRLARQMVRGNEFEDQATIEDVLAYQYCHSTFASSNDYLWTADEQRLTNELESSNAETRRLIVPVRPSEAQWDDIMHEVIG